MSDMNKLASELNKALNDEASRKPSAYDTPAEVLRVEGDTVWVHIPGGVDETPVRRTISANTGDIVQVHVANGGAWITGNATSPPTDDALAMEADTKAMEAQEGVKVIGVIAAEARDYADAAKEAADEAKETAEGIAGIAQEANDNAAIAKTAANTSIKNLSQVQSVLDVVNWVATHGIYVKATTYDATVTYYTVTATAEPSPFVERKYYLLNDDVYVANDVSATEVQSPVTSELPTYYEIINSRYVKTEDTEIVDGKTYYTIADTYYSVVGTPVADPKAEDIGTYYQLNVAEAMGDYINKHLALTNEGLFVMADDSKWRVNVADDGVYILDPDSRAANTMNSNGNIIGYEGETRAEIDYHSLKLIDPFNNSYFHVSDLRKREILDGYVVYLAEIENLANGSDPDMVEGRTVFLTHPIAVLEQALLNNDVDITENAAFVKDTTEIDFTDVTIGESDTVYVKYKTAAPSNAYTLGSRTVYDPIGAGSVVAGKYCIASGVNSYAEGLNTMASGDYSHAEGTYTVASGRGAHAEGGYQYHKTACKATGLNSHAEGSNTLASGISAHSEGSTTEAIGDDSHAEGTLTYARGKSSHTEGRETYAQSGATYAHAQNLGTIATKVAQTTIGMYNIKDESDDITYPYNTYTKGYGKYAFIIGNGAQFRTVQRSNALTVDWLGNTEIYASNIDRDAANPSSVAYGPAFIIKDKNGERIGTFRADKQTNDNMRLQIGVHNENSSGTEKSAWLGMLVDKSGVASYQVPTPANFRKAIGLESTLLTTTYTTNSYVNETAFNRIAARQYGDLVVVNGNLQITANVPKSSALVEIGKINLPKTAVQGAVQMIPCGTTGFLYLGIGTNGSITIYNYQNTNALGWCRFNCTLLLA